jgi:hypothetical protein
MVDERKWTRNWTRRGAEVSDDSDDDQSGLDPALHGRVIRQITIVKEALADVRANNTGAP